MFFFATSHGRTRACPPHLGYVERNGYEHAFGTIFDQILAYAARKPINVINPEALTRS